MLGGTEAYHNNNSNTTAVDQANVVSLVNESTELFLLFSQADTEVKLRICVPNVLNTMIEIIQMLAPGHGSSSSSSSGSKRRVGFPGLRLSILQGLKNVRMDGFMRHLGPSSAEAALLPDVHMLLSFRILTGHFFCVAGDD
jgi:hypothetical protein